MQCHITQSYRVPYHRKLQDFKDAEGKMADHRVDR
ncbi:hypothetical protein MTR67_017987 [Solanum verrucosum]|uniref:Uncharacterized protein n=1 Tax=Solanum verrucosum TaxID=315347 RepID=A0AAF0QKW2_SOLVR|nr:hypothetical protein MTR67_017987 [Solanum verrucosum]